MNNQDSQNLMVDIFLLSLTYQNFILCTILSIVIFRYYYIWMVNRQCLESIVDMDLGDILMGWSFIVSFLGGEYLL